MLSLSSLYVLYIHLFHSGFIYRVTHFSDFDFETCILKNPLFLSNILNVLLKSPNLSGWFYKFSWKDWNHFFTQEDNLFLFNTIRTYFLLHCLLLLFFYENILEKCRRWCSRTRYQDKANWTSVVNANYTAEAMGFLKSVQ